ncbi:phage head closure protein [Luteibacter sp. SG786]|uniref:phage head closure protein n=1 Tax=Luteibacter sp. SG786 TaxID=2587130 RepID=UPI00142116F2|nr:phage head closure protein [Luteibacter sp. SG786]NII53583.1 SPP1 family predicted phage head-tail adaptor [Luteibacter sp. SG786]
MPLAAGPLNRKITIQKPGTVKDPAGQPIKGWVDHVITWAKVKSQTGMGVVTGDQAGVSTSVTRYSFRIRYRQGLDASMRVLMGGVIYDITSVQMDEDRREWTDLVCNRGANSG